MLSQNMAIFLPLKTTAWLGLEIYIPQQKSTKSCEFSVEHYGHEFLNSYIMITVCRVKPRRAWVNVMSLSEHISLLHNYTVAHRVFVP